MSIKTWHDLFVRLPEVTERILDTVMRGFLDDDDWMDLKDGRRNTDEDTDADTANSEGFSHGGSKDESSQEDNLKNVLPLRLVCRDFKHIIDNYAKVWYCFDGDQPLLYPTILGHVQTIEKLLARGADVNKRGLLSRCENTYWFCHGGCLPPTPLDFAARVGNLESAKVLLENGAEMTPMDIIDDECNVPMSLLPVHFAVISGHIPFIDHLLFKGMDIDVRGNDNFTALHLAARVGNKEVVEWLITKGADVNAEDWDEMSPLAVALNNKKEPIARLIRAHGGQYIDGDSLVPEWYHYCPLCDRFFQLNEMEWMDHKLTHPSWKPRWDTILGKMGREPWTNAMIAGIPSSWYSKPSPWHEREIADEMDRLSKIEMMRTKTWLLTIDD